MTRLGIISDTHGHAAFTQQGIRMLQSLEPELVLHCGDIGSADLVELFAPWPTHFVFGNVDDDWPELEAAIAACGQTCHRRFGQLEVAGRKIAFLHGDDQPLLDQTIRQEQFDLVCHGHTHVARQVWLGRTLVLNPGAIYRANPRSVAIVELSDMTAHNLPLA